MKRTNKRIKSDSMDHDRKMDAAIAIAELSGVQLEIEESSGSSSLALSKSPAVASKNSNLLAQAMPSRQRNLKRKTKSMEETKINANDAVDGGKEIKSQIEKIVAKRSPKSCAWFNGEKQLVSQLINSNVADKQILKIPSTVKNIETQSAPQNNPTIPLISNIAKNDTVLNVNLTSPPVGNFQTVGNFQNAEISKSSSTIALPSLPSGNVVLPQITDITDIQNLLQMSGATPLMLFALTPNGRLQLVNLPNLALNNKFAIGQNNVVPPQNNLNVVANTIAENRIISGTSQNSVIQTAAADYSQSGKVSGNPVSGLAASRSPPVGLSQASVPHLPGSLRSLQDFYKRTTRTETTISTPTTASSIATPISMFRNISSICLPSSPVIKVNDLGQKVLSKVELPSSVGRPVDLSKSNAGGQNLVKEPKTPAVVSSPSISGSYGSLSILRSFYLGQTNAGQSKDQSGSCSLTDSPKSLKGNNTIVQALKNSSSAQNLSANANSWLDKKKNGTNLIQTNSGAVACGTNVLNISLPSPTTSIREHSQAPEVGNYSPPVILSPIRILPTIEIQKKKEEKGKATQCSKKKAKVDVGASPAKRQKTDSEPVTPVRLTQNCDSLDSLNILVNGQSFPLCQLLNNMDAANATQFCQQVLNASMSNSVNSKPATPSVPPCSEASNASSVSSGPIPLMVDSFKMSDFATSTPITPDERVNNKSLERNASSFSSTCNSASNQVDRTNGSASEQNRKGSVDANHPAVQPDEDGDFPLHIAVAKNLPQEVHCLILLMDQLGFSVDCLNNNRQTPLHMAIVTGQNEIAGRLLAVGANPNLLDRNGQSCLHLAVVYKNVVGLKMIFNCSNHAIDIDAMNYEGLTPLHIAVRTRLLDAVEVFLQYGANLDMQEGKSGHTALYMAAETNQLQLAEKLLQHRASTQISSYSGFLPTQAASAKSYGDMVKLLVKHGASEEDPNEKSPSVKEERHAQPSTGIPRRIKGKLTTA